MNDFEHPEDGWYQIEAAGEHPNPSAGIIQIIDATAVKSIVANFNREAGAPNFPGMLVDQEHFKYRDDKETRAFGWVTALQGRDDGLYAQIRWTGTGKIAVDNGDYRNFSTEYDLSDAQVLSNKKPRRLRPLRLDGLTLTNCPNNKGQNPITNRMIDNDETDSQPSSYLVIGASKVANDLSDDADSPASHEKAAIAHRRAAKLQKDAGHEETAQMHGDMAESHDRIAENLRQGAETASVANRLAPETASAELRRLAELHAGQTGQSFSDSYGLVRKTRPDLVQATQKIVPVDTICSREFQKVANRAAVIEGQQRRLVPINDGRFASERSTAIAEIRNRKVCSYDEAYNLARQENPHFWFEEAPDEDGEEEVTYVPIRASNGGQYRNRRKALYAR